ncbi:hypothetical protein [Pasteurella bettyae]|uniref:Type III restriction endonuclease EcoP15I, modification subunit domain protein n=1 Tax=Pasteurella bettyae CCUG 2042 TaxID=1095749 RepID=I3DI47_9PAST|nr:hypothetical protein [Pasteurella bettyae]EIJ71390.1 type III restriction endonuclease EcoP15I, modification subunit domain protein [Pasteurella bettyae CCUG 2042]SUB21726.1 type III restriction-modification system EcoP15I [Pasteurella bettyae]
MSNITQEILFSSNTQPESQAPRENERLAFLKQHFPNCFDKHGAFLPEKMAEELHAKGVTTQKEGYSLNWLGKSYAKVLRDTPPETLLAENIEHNQKTENTNSENQLIKGDNLGVLKHLKNAYKNAVKMIYIDPPYNTGSEVLSIKMTANLRLKLWRNWAVWRLETPNVCWNLPRKNPIPTARG